MKALGIRDLLFLVIATLALAFAPLSSVEAGEIRVSVGQEIIHETDDLAYGLQVAVPGYPGVVAALEVTDDNTFYTASYRFAWSAQKGMTWPALFVTVGGGYASDRTDAIADSFIARAEIGVRLTDYVELSAVHWSTPGQDDRGDNAAFLSAVLPLRL